jgi:hypothetical protein
MKYCVFDTEEQALAAEAQVAADIGCIKIGTNAKTGQLVPEAQATERWAVVQQITDGRWVFVSPDDEGVEAGVDWWPQEEII